MQCNPVFKATYLAANRQEGGFAVEPSLLPWCGLESHDFDPSEAWTVMMMFGSLLNIKSQPIKNPL
jgi:hypothetical protein